MLAQDVARVHPSLALKGAQLLPQTLAQRLDLVSLHGCNEACGERGGRQESALTA